MGEGFGEEEEEEDGRKSAHFCEPREPVCCSYVTRGSPSGEAAVMFDASIVVPVIATHLLLPGLPRKANERR